MWTLSVYTLLIRVWTHRLNTRYKVLDIWCIWGSRKPSLSVARELSHQEDWKEVGQVQVALISVTLESWIDLPFPGKAWQQCPSLAPCVWNRFKSENSSHHRWHYLWGRIAGDMICVGGQIREFSKHLIITRSIFVTIFNFTFVVCYIYIIYYRW